MRCDIHDEHDTSGKCSCSKIVSELRMPEDDIWLLIALGRDVNRTAYHGGLGLQESGKYLALIDRILKANGWSVAKATAQ